MTIDFQPALIGVLSAGLLGLIASVVRGAMFNRSEHNVRRHESRGAMLRAQIGELYSPLLGHLHEVSGYFEILDSKLDELEQLALADRSQAATLAAQAVVLRRKFAELYFEPLFGEVARLLRGCRHLVAEDGFPEYLTELLRFAVRLEATRTVAVELGHDADSSPEDCADAAASAAEHVECVLLRLRAQYRRHLRSLGKMQWGRTS